MQNMDIALTLKSLAFQRELLNSSKTRVSVSQYAALWTHLSDAMDDEFFGMDSHAMRRGSFN